MIDSVPVANEILAEAPKKQRQMHFVQKKRTEYLP
jgi:hypothetical protein